MTKLTDQQHALITKARELADLNGPGLRAWTGEHDLGLAMASVLGECQHTLRELAGLAEMLAVLSDDDEDDEDGDDDEDDGDGDEDEDYAPAPAFQWLP